MGVAATIMHRPEPTKRESNRRPSR